MKTTPEVRRTLPLNPNLLTCFIDEYDHITTRSLALSRFKRNHDYMHEVFLHAAYGKSFEGHVNMFCSMNCR